jgi:hypothetical protein
MAFNDLVLSLLTFPQNWTPGSIPVRFLALPSADPTLPLTVSGPKFAGTGYKFQPFFIPGLDAFPDLSVAPIPLNFVTAPTLNVALANTLFTNFKAKYGIVPNNPSPPAPLQIKKTLPQSYLIAAGFETGQSNLLSNDKDFGCAMHQKDPGTKASKPGKLLSWGQLFSFALRQPQLALGLGLLYEGTVQITQAQAQNGGWLFVSFGLGANPYQADLAGNPDLIRVFATRIPPLSAANRTLFAAVLFPVGKQPTDIQTVTTAEIEAQRYDHGFGLIVHGNQPDSIDAAVGDPNSTKPASDAGIQIGWDDEQVTIWHNRQLLNMRARVDPATTPVPLPLGVSGYRVDVRETGSLTWTSLHVATTNLSLALPSDSRTPFEPPIEPSATRSVVGADFQAWLPRYFAQWRGGSLAVADPLPQMLINGANFKSSSIVTAADPAVKLLYGHTYDFRVRYADLTLGGPLPDTVSDATDSGLTTINFKRFLPPKQLRASVTASAGTISSINLWRPILSYPEFAFTGLAVPADFAARAAAAKAANGVFGAADPDVNSVLVTVEARTPAHDNTDPDTLDGPFRIIYNFEVPIPSASGDVFADPPPAGDALTLQLQYVDTPRISAMAAPALSGSNVQAVPIPRARDVRIRVKPIAQHDHPDRYFGNNAQASGLESHFDTRSNQGGVENQLFDPAEQPVDRARSLIFQPGDNIPQRLASELGLQVDGLTFSGPPGERLAFGCSAALRHTLSGDHSAVTFAALTELLNHWVVALRFTVNRDWTWDGLSTPAFTVSGDFNKQNGVVEIRQTVAQKATEGAVHREFTRVIYFDAVDPKPAPGKFPVAPFVTWTVKPVLDAGLTTADSLTIPMHLPKACQPAQVPVIASAGIALSAYEALPGYTDTKPRDRSLWIEFTEPVSDPADTYFARVLAYAPDPLLAPFTHVPVLQPEPPLPIDPEPVRVIVPAQSADTSGLQAMQPMSKAADSEVHYLLPLPPGIAPDARELFGFWTYEIRCGHTGDDLEHWSTAQGRFGRQLRVTAVQHPAPGLRCYPYRDPTGISVRVPFASPVFGGRRLISGGDFRPQSEIWVFLYAQLMQADGATNRNVLLLEANATVENLTADSDPFGIAVFPAKGAPSIQSALTTLSLPSEIGMSVLAVELLPATGARSIDATIHCSLAGRRILRTSPLTAVNAIC